MKSLFIPIMLAAFLFNAAKAQVCTPGNYPEPGVYPSDTTAGLKKACENTLYTETITIKVAATIEANGATYQIQSIKVNDLLGLPSGISYACNPSNCIIPGGNSGCISLSGTPTVPGTYPLTAFVTVNIAFGFFTFPIDTSLPFGNLIVQAKDCAGVCGGNAVIHTLNLSSGWNLISSYIAPAAPAMPSVFANIQNKVIIVKSNTGGSYIPSIPINTIGNWSVTQGYQVKTNAPVSINNFCGNSAISQPLSLSSGWNMISYLKDTPMNAITAFASLGNNLAIVKNNVGQSYIPGLGINTIGNLIPGQGYKIKMVNSAVFTYPEN